MPLPRQVFIAVIGAGGVGRSFLSQLHFLGSKICQSPSSPTYLSLILLSTSKKLLYSKDYHPIHLDTWEDDLAASTHSGLSPHDLVEYLSHAPNKVVLIDNTSNQELADAYPVFLKKGINIVTPNKKAFSGSYKLWQSIFSSAANGTGSGGYVFHESSVGAGLPVICTLKSSSRPATKCAR